MNMTKWQSHNLQTRLYLIALAILLAGLGSALVVYLAAGASDVNPMISEFEQSKKYTHSIEVYGGNMAVMADQLDRWFASLWHGRALAGTITFLAVVLAAGVALVAYFLPAAPSSGELRDRQP